MWEKTNLIIKKKEVQCLITWAVVNLYFCPKKELDFIKTTMGYVLNLSSNGKLWENIGSNIVKKKELKVYMIH